MTKRIIPCLDVKDGRVVKGVNFTNLKDAGDPVELACLYDKEGADEIVLLDISASWEGRKTTIDIVEKACQKISVPLIIGGGISSLEDMKNLFNVGVSKISLNTAAVKNPEIIRQGAQRFGSNRIILACDAKKQGDMWEVYISGGKIATGLDAIEWVKEAVALGAGEILLTSMDADGTNDGYDIELTSAVANAAKVPVIASGGAGEKKHFYDIFKKGCADAALAASVFHFGKIRIKEVKEYLISEGIDVNYDRSC